MTVGQALRDEGRIEGRQEGRREGRQEGRIEGRQEGRIEGRQEGRIEGRVNALRDALVKLVQQRFGAVPAEVTARIEQADSESLERWIERVIPAATLADIFAD